jgi:glycosyltransferase involved in cell wall biosynthesis
MKLRVGLVGPLPPPSGGMANQTLQLARLLRAEGLQVQLVQVNPPYRPAWAARLRGLRALCRLLPYLLRLWRCAGQSDLLHVMANSGWSWHLFAVPAIWIGRWRGTPVLVNYRGGEAEAFFARSLRWVRPSMERASAVVVPSGFLEDVFLRHGMAALVVPNVVDLARFAPAARPRRQCILVARNLEAIYDNASALRALALLRATHPQACMVIAGSGPLRAELEQLASQLGVREAVRFAGRVDHAQMAALYAEADVMLNPSLVDNMPNAVLEALASGVPVVSTRAGGVPYMVQDGRTALLVKPGSAPEMAAALACLFDLPALGDALAAAGQREVVRYDWNAVRPQLLAVYERMV